MAMHINQQQIKNICNKIYQLHGNNSNNNNKRYTKSGRFIRFIHLHSPRSDAYIRCIWVLYRRKRKIQLALHANNVRQMAVPVSVSGQRSGAHSAAATEKKSRHETWILNARCMLGSSAHNTPQFEGNAKHSARVQIQSTHTKLSHTTYALWLYKMSIAVARLFG